MQNGVIVYLSKQSDSTNLYHSLRLLCKNFINEYKYPVVIFHDDITPVTISNILVKIAQEFNYIPNIKFEKVVFQVPSWISLDRQNYEVKDGMYPSLDMFPMGYRNMCRFFSGEIFKHKALSNYRYCLRVDSDGFILSKIKNDIFEIMNENNYCYAPYSLGRGGNSDAEEVEWARLGLHELTINFAKENKDIVKNIPVNWKGELYNSNLELMDMDYFRDTLYQKFYNYVDQSGGIYYRRWGDTVIRWLGINMFKDSSSVWCLRDGAEFCYLHGSEIGNSEKCSNDDLDLLPEPYKTNTKNKILKIESNNKIIQISMVKNEIDIIKHMLPLWQKYADGFVFMDDNSTDGTYEYLLENKEKYNIIKILRTDRKANEISFYESVSRQQMYNEAIKHSNKIVCLDADEYLDGSYSKEHLIKLLNDNPDTLFYSRWIQYTGNNQIRVDGKWKVHWVDRFSSYSFKSFYKDKQTHGEHLPVPSKIKYIDYPDLFVSHLAWLASKESIAIKQYHYKIWDYVNKLEYGTSIINPVEYDYSVNNFNWDIVTIPYKLKVPIDIYSNKEKDIRHSKQYKYIKDSIKKYNIPNLNDWGLGIH